MEGERSELEREKLRVQKELDLQKRELERILVRQFVRSSILERKRDHGADHVLRARSIDAKRACEDFARLESQCAIAATDFRPASVDQRLQEIDREG